MNFLLKKFLVLAGFRDIQHIFYTLFARSRHDTNLHGIVYLNIIFSEIS